jgi:hypothetical protein
LSESKRHLSLLPGLLATLLVACGVGGADNADTVEADTRLTSGNGLVAEYFNNSDFTAPVLTRTDATINFNWGSGSPAPSIGADTFSVRWTGYIEPRYGESYTFSTRSDDGVRLWINGQQIINNWTLHSPTENSSQVTLSAGQRYALKMEFYENGGGAVAQLRWSSARQAKEIVPSAQLFTAAAASSCANLTVSAASLTSTPTDGSNLAAYVLDNNFDTRWSSFGKGAWIQTDLGATKSLCSVSVAWHQGNARTNTFQIGVSNDGVTFTTAFSGQSSGATLALEQYTFSPVSGRYLRVTVNGNTLNDWASISELRVAGSDASAPPSSDTTPPSAPANLAALASSSSTVNLTWSAATDNVGVTGYVVTRAGATVASLGNVTSYQDTGLAPSTAYAYAVKARDAAGNLSASSNSASATTQAASHFHLART